MTEVARVGRYRLLRQLGEGGFGVVHLAEQTEPVRRLVALKVLKRGLDTRKVIARFEAERQALALMDHPHIARVLDAGATENGRPYFVMEYVEGVPITDYCAALDVPARLELFQQVCHAVQHAHVKGIIHRDLKPSNVLVSVRDGHPTVKVIDFGVAKAVDHRLTEKTFFTECHQIIGTPEYMAPEQAEPSGLDVDTRADVYSLGVLLYELLTETRPFDLAELMRAGYAETLRTIREVDPPRPSARVHTLPTDLDWIVMRALEKDRARRYATAHGLAMDIQRHLRDEPVAAGPPRALYRARKYVRRHRVGVAAATVAAAALLTGASFAATGFVEASRERAAARFSLETASREARSAEAARTREAGMRRLAEAREESARRSAATAREVLELLRRLLCSADPHEAWGRHYTVRQLLEDFERTLPERVRDRPAVEAAVRTTIDRAYSAIGGREPR